MLRRVDANGVQEVVLATNPNMTGEATAAFLADRLRGRVRVTRLASGLPVGGDLEYADEVTLGRALSGARDVTRVARLDDAQERGAVGDPEADGASGSCAGEEQPSNSPRLSSTMSNHASATSSVPVPPPRR